MRQAGEVTCVGLFLAYLAWVPMPFGSIVPGSYIPLVLPPMLICAAAAALRARDGDRLNSSLPFRIWTAGGAALILVVALQLIPVPPSLLDLLSPESSEIWQRSDSIVALAAGRATAAASFHPISVDPIATSRELLRLIALFATFQAAAMLVYDKTRRLLFASTLAAAAMFEALYGVREAALQRYAIWGWPNRLIFGRVTGTFVNPNHFGHYLAIVFPPVLFIGASAWHRVAVGTVSLRRQLSALAAGQLTAFGASVVAALACIGGILLSQSRGALLALLAGLAFATCLVAVRREPETRGVSRRRERRRRIVRLAAIAGIAVAATSLVLVLTAMLLGSDRTITRFRGLQHNPTGLVGRADEIRAAAAIWKRFPLLGSGAGTFEQVVSLAQKDNLEAIFQHAHDDYVELGATTGIVGFAVALVALFAGAGVLVRRSVDRTWLMSWNRDAFVLAALTSLAIASVHALFDFNFYMPANATTIAAITGAAVALRVRPPEQPRAVSADHHAG